MAAQVTCPGCKTALGAEQFLSACRAWFADVDCVAFICPHCRQGGQAQLENGRVVHGFIYAAGRAYFSPQLSESLPGLALARLDAGLEISFGELKRIVPRT